jgi:hypothetical protein
MVAVRGQHSLYTGMVSGHTPNLLGTRCDSEEGLGLDAVIKSITCNRRGTRHILVRGICARTDQTDLELLGPVVGLDGLGELGDGCGKIRGERTVDVWLEFRKVELDDLVVLLGCQGRRWRLNQG